MCDATTGPEAATAAAFAAGLRAVLRGEEDEFSLEYPCHSPDQQRWFLGQVSRLEGVGQARAVVLHENITHRVLSEYGLRIKESALASSLDGIALTDLDGNVSYVNASLLRLWGYSSPS